MVVCLGKANRKYNQTSLDYSVLKALQWAFFFGEMQESLKSENISTYRRCGETAG